MRNPTGTVPATSDLVVGETIRLVDLRRKGMDVRHERHRNRRVVSLPGLIAREGPLDLLLSPIGEHPGKGHPSQ